MICDKWKKESVMKQRTKKLINVYIERLKKLLMSKDILESTIRLRTTLAATMESKSNTPDSNKVTIHEALLFTGFKFSMVTKEVCLKNDTSQNTNIMLMSKSPNDGCKLLDA